MGFYRLIWIKLVIMAWSQIHQVELMISLDGFSSQEIMHLFGTATPEKGSIQYSHFTPVKSTQQNGSSIFTLTYLDQHYRFLLTPAPLHDDPNQNGYSCTYRGIGLSHPGSTLALVDCTGSKRGLVITETGDVLLFHPLPSASTQRSPASPDHIIHKRDIWRLESAENIEETMVNKTCLFDGAKYTPNQPNVNRTRLAVIRGPLTVELALFADEKLWHRFQSIYGSANADNQLHSFILAVVNNVNLLFNHHSLEPKIQMKIKRYQVLKETPPLLRDEAHNSGDVDMLLENFCQYQDSFNPSQDSDPKHWDHALLFTGYDLYRGSLKTVAGYAPVKGMCSGLRSCTINEGMDFGSAFVITHEMGHSLGMFHDGDNGCDAGCCVMSPSVGAGKTTWSTCSVREFNEFLNELGTPPTGPNCLLDGGDEIAVIDYSLHGEYPGQRYNADQQCRLYHGSCWKQELREGQKLEEICDMIWCGEGEGVIRTAHPALEGTYCAENKWCLQGVCRAWPSNSIPPQPVDGSWTPWNDAPSDGCQLNCDSPCLVEGQIMIKRSIRQCENPPVNNGGKPCEGTAYRGFICSNTVCDGPKPNEYASNICTNLRDGTGPGGGAISQLSGRGFQHQDQPCRIWCQLFSDSFARSVGNFPDGTPCGTDHYCIRGQCMKRSCGGSVLVMEDKDCPSTSTDRHSAEQGVWSPWSAWSSCSITCGGGGRRQRTRTCQNESCKGSGNQLQPCHAHTRCPSATKIPIDSADPNFQPNRHFTNVWLPWGDWSQCDVSCGMGLRQRTRECASNACTGNAIQSKTCEIEECSVAGTWSSWTPWSQCAGICGQATQERRRFCRGNPSCLGNNAETRLCDLDECPLQDENLGLWSTWSEWSLCSKTCGQSGMQYRIRLCSTSQCRGSNVSFSGCNLFDCPPEFNAITLEPAIRREGIEGKWTEWTNWSGCSKTCGANESEQRFRTCLGGRKDDKSNGTVRCIGPHMESRLCSNIACPGK